MHIPQDISTTSAKMSALDPTGPSQPKLDQVYQAEGNPSQKEPAEKSAANANAHAPATGEERIPSQTA